MAATAMRDSPDMANGGHGSRMMSYENDPTQETTTEQPYKSSKSKSKGASRQGPPGRSFSVRAQDANLSSGLEEPSPHTPSSYIDESYTPRGMPLNSHPPDPQPTAQENKEPEPLQETTSIPKVSSPPSRSNTMRSTSSSQRRDWASDRSPLQKLEVTLNGISKEEKRARVQEAEMKLRERLARQKVEREQAEAAAAAAATTAVAIPAYRPGSQRSYSEDRRPSDTGPVAATRNAQSNLRQATGAPTRHRRNESTNPQYPEVQRPEGAQYARAEVALPTSARMGSVHRKQVSVSGPVSRPGPVADDMKHSRSVSQQGPYPSRQAVAATAGAAAAVISNEERLDTPPAVRAQTSVESHSRPKKHQVSFNVPPPTPPPVFEWKNAEPARLTAAEFDFQNLDIDRGKTWWEGGGTKDRRKSRALPKNYQTPAQKLTGVNHHKLFQPRLFLRCGPLLRYTGMKKTTVDGIHGVVEKETWRGSVLIVTKDSRSDYNTPPTLRLFAQPMDLLPPPPAEISREDGVQLAPEYIDPTANLMKVGRDGRPLYVKRVDRTEEELDLSSVENDDGLYGMRPSSPDDKSEPAQPIPANRIHSIDGETASLHREIPGARLYADAARDVTFWRFNLEVELGTSEQRIAYRINEGPALGFWVPAAGQPMNIAFHSGNGFTPSVDTNRFCGPDPLWRDILNEHQTKPFHVMIGGGDQIFNDCVITESPYFQEWMKIKNPAERYSMPFTPEFRADLEQFYLHRYASWFSQGLFSLANSQIPMVNMWNDHEIFEGYGSYNVDFMSSMVISGLGRIAHKFYLLFQHHCVPDETEADEPSWILGYQLGPYIPQKSRHIFMSLGSDVMLLGLDCRTERTSNEVLSEKTYDLIWDRCYNEINKGETKHLIVLCSVPVAYPRVAMLKNIMNSRKSLGKAGMFGGLVNRTGGSVEVYDDHWAGKHLKAERTWLIEDLQDIAAEKSVRITILSGDVHLAGIGQFYSNPKLDVAKDKDYRYIPNVISSAIADMPETDLISDMLNRRNTVHHIDSNTDEDVIPIFTEDVDGKSRNNKRLLPRRNWLSIREYRPGQTPPDTPDSETPTPTPQESRPNKLQRTLSLGRGDRGPSDGPNAGPAKSGGLLRRLSGRRPPPTRAMSFGREGEAPARRASVDITSISRPLESGESYFPGAPNEPQPGRFHRRPTNLSEKAAKKAAKHGDDGLGAFVDLQGGLAITLNMEVNPQDPAGITVPYKMLVPALRYERDPSEPRPTQVVKGWRKWLNMPRRNKNEDLDYEEGDDEEDVDDYEDDDTINNTRANAAATAAASPPQQHQHQHYDEYPSDESESEVPQRLRQHELAESSPEEEDYDEEPVPKRKGKKWFGME